MGAFTIFSIIASILTGAASVWSQHRANDENSQRFYDQLSWSEQQANAANQRTEDMYNRLYSPAAKVTQLKAAGLSPGLMYGGGAAGGQSSTTAVQAAQPAAPVINPIIDKLLMSQMMETISKVNDTKRTDNEIEKTDAQIDQMKAQIPVYEAQVKKMMQETNNLEIEEMILNETKKQQEIETRIKSATQEQKIGIVNQELTNMLAEYNKIFEETRGLKIDADNKERMINEQVKLMISQAGYYAALAAQSEEQVKLIQAEVKKVEKEVEKMQFFEKNGAWLGDSQKARAEGQQKANEEAFFEANTVMRWIRPIFDIIRYILD